MSGVSTMEKMLAIVRRDVLTGLRYRNAFIMTSVGVVAELAAFYYLSRAIGPEFRPQGMDYFAFLLVGSGFYTFLMLGMSSFLSSVQEAQQNGTLEVLMTTATPAPVLVMLSAVSAFGRNTVRLVLYLSAGLLLLARTGLSHPNVLGCLAVFLLSVVIAVAIGMVAAALQLAAQKGSAVIWMLGSLAWFMTGTMFPVSTLPRPLAFLAGLIPITHCLTAMRLALVQGAGFSEIGREMGILTIFAAVLLPLSVVLFSFTVNRARLHGTLSFY